MSLPFKLDLKTKSFVASLIVLLSQNVVFSYHLEHKTHPVISCMDNTPAAVKKHENGNSFVYSFQRLSSPEQIMLDQSLERFRQIDGFISLSLNSQNEVELVTKSTITEQNNTRLLLVSTRLYGYTGYQIID